MRKQLLALFTAMILLSSLLVCPVMAAPGGQDTLMANKDTEVIYLVSVEKGYLALRNEPAYDESNEIARLYTGDVVEVISATGRYWFVYAPGPSLYGFADSRYLYADTVSAARDTYASYPSANTPTTVIVQSGFLALRSEPVFRDSNIIGKMYTGDTVEVINTYDDIYWYVYCPKLGRYGYTDSRYLANVYYRTVKVKTGYLALRNATSYDSRNEIGKLYTGDIVMVISSTSSEYYYVYAPSLKKYGYVNGNYLVN